jgi:hypothetical protein
MDDLYDLAAEEEVAQNDSWVAGPAAGVRTPRRRRGSSTAGVRMQRLRRAAVGLVMHNNMLKIKK